MRAIKVSLFTSSTQQGENLAEILQEKLSAHSINGLDVELETVYDGDSEDMMISGLEDDIVIFDASVEDAIGSNYKTTKMWPLCMEHFLVISRTRLPINFEPFHSGGSPDSWGNLLERPFSLTNEQLADWIESQLKLLSGNLPRPDEDRLTVPKGQFGVYAKKIGPLTIKLITQSLKRREKIREKSGKAFVSYLSKYSIHHRYGKSSCGFYIEDVLTLIKEYHSDPDYPVLYYPPGSLSSEFMAEYRRWQVVRMIEDRIRAADEFWIFETDDYYDSWWTQAELAILAYIRHDDEHPIVGKRPPPKVMICRPDGTRGLQIQKASSDFVRELNYATARELGRCLSNNSSYTSAYIRRLIGSLPLPIRWLGFQGGKIMQKGLQFVTGFSMMSMFSKEDLKQMTFSLDNDLQRARAFTSDFWDSRIVTCPNCTERNEAKNKFDFSTFIEHSSVGQYRLSQEAMSNTLESGTWQCPGCSFRFDIIEEPHPQFRWWEARLDRPTGPDGVYVERIPMYSLRQM